MSKISPASPGQGTCIANRDKFFYMANTSNIINPNYTVLQQ